MVLIPEGEFWMGSDPEHDPKADKDEMPQHRLFLPEYWIALTPVSNAQYEIFVRDATYRSPADWKGGRPPAGGIEAHFGLHPGVPGKSGSASPPLFCT